MTTDLTFFTNEPDAALLDRFKATLRDVRFFDVLVGYFRTSGFYLLADALEEVEEIRILVGLGVDRQTLEIVEASEQQLELAFQSARQTKDLFADELVDEMERSADTYDTERGVRTFMQWLQSGKLKLKAHPSHQIHAKVYISRFPSHDRDFGRVITGSSNFSYAGLLGNYEFNVELKDAPDVRFALAKFEELWAEAVDISDAYVDTIQRRTWLNDQISPYDLYLKFLYEYFKEDINADQEIDVWLPEGFLDLAYQKQAVTAARKILDAYGGVFLADVVGLGKTFIAALLAQQLPGRKLVICPPVLKDYWQETLREFGVPARVESMGKLDRLLQGDYQRYDVVFVDEAHRFRNEGTQGYEKLHRICWGRKVVLVSATPLNNTIGDVFTQLKLFQAPRRSTIPGVSDLESFFGSRMRWLESFEKGSPEHLAAVKLVAEEVRDCVLKHVMVRRTRSEITRFFQEDINQQGLAFPELANPQRIIYRFDAATEAAFDATIQRLRGFSYARYTPLLYLKAGVSQLEEQSQRNVGGFMKGLLVKRLESSFFALDEVTRRQLVSADPRSVELIKPWLRGRDIARWIVRDSGRYLLYIPWDCPIENYPAIKKHLARFEDGLLQRDGVKDGGPCPWYALSRPRPENDWAFVRPKIVYPHFNTMPNFAYDTRGSFSNDKTYIVPDASKFLLGVLNSNLTNFFLRQLAPSVQQGYMEFRTIYVGQIPVPSALPDQEAAITAVVDRLVDAKGQGPQVAQWERELNVLVYELYGLTEDEIAIVEGRA